LLLQQGEGCKLSCIIGVKLFKEALDERSIEPLICDPTPLSKLSFFKSLYLLALPGQSL